MLRITLASLHAFIRFRSHCVTPCQQFFRVPPPTPSHVTSDMTSTALFLVSFLCSVVCFLLRGLCACARVVTAAHPCSGPPALVQQQCAAATPPFPYLISCKCDDSHGLLYPSHRIHFPVPSRRHCQMYGLAACGSERTCHAGAYPLRSPYFGCAQALACVCM